MKPYGSDSPLDWMNTRIPDLMDRYVPGWRDRSYGDLLRVSPSEWWGMIYPQSAASTPTLGRAPWSVPGRDRSPHPRGCRCRDCVERRCERCGADRCECTCCIGDVDLVVYTRVGEQRVIPIVVENERRREKSITVELSPWRTRGGGASLVDTVSVEPKAFTLAPCAEREVVVVARVSAPQSAAANQAVNAEGQREPRDVDECLVVTADLSLVGCDHRPIRIAIAILPRDCDGFRIPCGCGCC